MCKEKLDFIFITLLFRRIVAAKYDLHISDIYASVKASLQEGLAILHETNITEIVCFGLGKIGESVVSRYQLALLLCLKDLYGVKVCAYDPVFDKSEKLLLKKLDCEILDYNLEGKYSITNCRTTLFYLPHCPKQLCNNLLWSNWGLQLSHCIIISNSFSKIIELTPKRLLLKSAQYILNISPHVVELAVINNFKYYDIFNDTAIHIFPIQDISLISDDFWKLNKEPHYSDDDIEFITKKTDVLEVTH